MKTSTHTPKPQKRAGRIGVTFGAMDLCHAGHMLMLKEAKEQCDYLIVGLHDDPSKADDISYRLNTGGKAKNTPIMSIEERRTILEGIKYVDEVFVYGTEQDMYNWLKNNHYDVRIIGADWKGKPYTGHDLPHTIFFNTRSHNYSTSELRRRVYEAEKAHLESGSVNVVAVPTHAQS